jgi:hypothetical protein
MGVDGGWRMESGEWRPVLSRVEGMENGEWR